MSETYTTVSVHDPDPGDVEIQNYERDGEPRIRLRLGLSAPGFGGVAIHAASKEMVDLLVNLLGRVAQRPATLQLDGRGEYTYTEKGIGSVLAAPAENLGVVAPIHDPDAKKVVIPMRINRERKPGMEVTYNLWRDSMPTCPPDGYPDGWEYHEPVGPIHIEGHDPTAPWAHTLAGEEILIEHRAGSVARVLVASVEEGGMRFRGDIISEAPA